MANMVTLTVTIWWAKIKWTTAPDELVINKPADVGFWLWAEVVAIKPWNRWSTGAKQTTKPGSLAGMSNQNCSNQGNQTWRKKWGHPLRYTQQTWEGTWWGQRAQFETWQGNQFGTQTQVRFRPSALRRKRQVHRNLRDHRRLWTFGNRRHHRKHERLRNLRNHENHVETSETVWKPWKLYGNPIGTLDTMEETLADWQDSEIDRSFYCQSLKNAKQIPFPLCDLLLSLLHIFILRVIKNSQIQNCIKYQTRLRKADIAVENHWTDKPFYW